MSKQGMLPMMVMMASMMPEEEVIDRAISTLTEYKLKGFPKDEQPHGEIGLLMLKWRNEGRSVEDSLKELREQEEALEFGKGIHESLNKPTN